MFNNQREKKVHIQINPRLMWRVRKLLIVIYINSYSEDHLKVAALYSRIKTIMKVVLDFNEILL